MSKNYHPLEIEKKWAKKWEKTPARWQSETSDSSEVKEVKKFYALVEFPYPSGEGLHIGHAFTNTILDVLVRQKRAEGLRVMHPMGWDAFGLPTENYAVKTGIQPAKLTKRNTDRFRSQLKRMALSYDWDREVNTTDPSYYKWTQWIFLQMFKHGLAYKQSTPVGWCPSCKSILANEEIVGGNCERCGHEAEHREQEQWLLKITAYADRLADELDSVDYPDHVKASQKNWIGRKEWIDIDYPIEGTKETVSVSTTRPDTNFGATFVVLAPEHPLIDMILKEKVTIGANQGDTGGIGEREERLKEIRDYVQQAKKKSELERISEGRAKTGVFTGLYAVNQLNDYRMPIWITDFVLSSIGTGAVVGVPGHDRRDFEFAKKFGLEVVRVVVGSDGDQSPITKNEQVQEEEGTMINSEFLNGKDIHRATKKMMDYLEKKGWGKRTIRYHLRDWIFSRQHYWGEPIPMIFCGNCARQGISWWNTQESRAFLKSKIKNQKSNTNIHTGSVRMYSLGVEEKKRLAGWFPVSEKDLPLKLPQVEKYQPTDTGESPLSKIKDWVKTKCPHCGQNAQRETDTMPNWAGSSWYFLRYCDPKNNSKLADPEKLKAWMPVDLYLGGAEHNTLHLLYSRFWHKFLNDIGAVPGEEPYQSRRQHGVILGEDGQRMSKSRGNTINPEDVMDKFGADTLRVYLMFMGPYDSTMPWSAKGVEGSYRFLSRIWRAYTESPRKSGKAGPGENHPRGVRKYSPGVEGEGTDLRKKLHQTIKKVTEDIEALKHNTAIAALMEFLNEWTAAIHPPKNHPRGGSTFATTFLQLLAPFAPYLAEELYQSLRSSPITADKEADKRRSSLISAHQPKNQRSSVNWSIHHQPWPHYDPKLVKEEKVTIMIQVNGKVRGQVEIKNQISKIKNEVEKLAKAEKNVAKHLKGKKLKKVIFIPGKLINFVV
ncbi:leucine--tRNA ligase [Patescibacteria group bacterium]